MREYILGISGSPREEGNTDIAVKQALNEIQEHKAVDTNFIRIADFEIEHCVGCRKCMELGRCAIDDDDFNRVMDEILKAAVVVLGAPVYWNGPPGVMKDFIDRSHGYYAVPERSSLAGKKVGIISVATAGGFASHEDVIQSWLRYYGATIVDKVRIYACEKGELLTKPSELQKVRALADTLCQQM